METWSTSSSLRRFKCTRQRFVDSRKLFSRFRRYASRSRQLCFRSSGTESTCTEVLGRVRFSRKATEGRARRSDGAQTERLAPGRGLRGAHAGAFRRSHARFASKRIHLAKRKTQPRRAPPRMLRPTGPGSQDVHGVRRRRRHHEPAPGRERRRERDGARQRAGRRARASAGGGARGRGRGRGRAVAAARARQAARRAVAHLRGARRGQDPRLPRARGGGARRAAARGARPRARPDVVPGRGAARAPVPRVRRGGLRHPAVPRRRRVRAGRRAAPGAQPARLHQGRRGLRLARERVAVLRARAAVPAAVSPAREQGGQAADKEHRVPRGEGLPLLPGGRARRDRVKSSGPRN